MQRLPKFLSIGFLQTIARHRLEVIDYFNIILSDNQIGVLSRFKVDGIVDTMYKLCF